MVSGIASGFPQMDSSVRTRRYAATGASITAAFVASLMSSSVMAEVCDKVGGEGWSQGDGALWLFLSQRFPVVPLGLAGAFFLAVLFRMHWLGLVVSGALLVLAVLESLILFEDDKILSSATNEGCFSAPRTLSSIGALLLVAVLSFLVVRRRSAGDSLSAELKSE